MARATIAPTRMAEKATWRIGACMSVRRRPRSSCFIVFRRFDGNLVRALDRTRVAKTEQMFYNSEPPVSRLQTGATRGTDPVRRTPLPHQFLVPRRGSAPDDLVERAVELGLTGLAVTDHNGLYGAVRFVSAAEAAGLHPVVGLEIELLDPAVADPSGIVIPPRRPRRRRHGERNPAVAGPARRRPPTRPRAAARRDPTRARLPVTATGQGGPARDRRASRGPHLVLLARSQVGWRSLCRLISHANMAGTKGMPRFSQALLAEHTEGRSPVGLP